MSDHFILGTFQNTQGHITQAVTSNKNKKIPIKSAARLKSKWKESVSVTDVWWEGIAEASSEALDQECQT